jgi:hypothetical protein
MTEEEKEEYRKKISAKLDTLKVGGTDQNNNLIVHIFARGDEYVVYEIKTSRLIDSVRVRIDNLTPTDETGVLANYGQIRMEFVRVKEHLYLAVDKDSIKSRVANILAHGIITNPAEANEKFRELREDIKKEYKSQFYNRIKLLAAPSFLLIIFAFLSAFLTCNCGRTADICFCEMLYVLTGGIIGGYFSMLIGIRKLRCEEDTNKYRLMYLCYGLIRIMIAILGSVIIYFAIKVDLIAGFCNELNNPTLGYIVFSVLAGFSESLVPNFLTKLESKTNES